MSESCGRTVDEELAELYPDVIGPQFATIEAIAPLGAVAAIEREHIPDITGWSWEGCEDSTYPAIRARAPCGCKQVFTLRTTLLGGENWIAPGELEMCDDSNCKFNYAQSYEAAQRAFSEFRGPLSV